MNSKTYGLVKNFKKEVFDNLSLRKQLKKYREAIAEWVDLHKQAILIAWWAEHGVGPEAVILVEKHALDGAYLTYIRPMSQEEKESAKTEVDLRNLGCQCSDKAYWDAGAIMINRKLLYCPSCGSKRK